MQLPSNKVAATLTIVVLIVAGTITLSFVDFEKPIKNLESVELVIERKTDTISDENWLDNLAYIKATQPAPGGPIIEGLEYNPDSVTSKASVDLFSEYLMLKQKGLLTEEDNERLTKSISEKIVNDMPENRRYTIKDLNTTSSSLETVKIYGDRLAQATINHFTVLDSFKNQKETFTYFVQLSNQYKKYADELLSISVPTVAQDTHLQIIHSTLDTKIFFDSLITAGDDPLVAIATVAQYQAKSTTDMQLYTTLANYFKNNGIIFETESTINFWKFFE